MRWIVLSALLAAPAGADTCPAAPDIAERETALLDRVRKALDDLGTLEVIRHGIEMTGARAKVELAQFKPALKLNPALQARYAANRLRIVRLHQVTCAHAVCQNLLNGFFQTGRFVALIKAVA